MATNLNQPNELKTGSDARMVIGVFQERSDLNAALDDLRAAGFSSEQIGVLARDQGDWPANGDRMDEDAKDTVSGAAAGAATGASLGGLWALGIAAGVLPAIGPVVAGGILGSILASATAGAAVGVVAGGLIGLGLSETDAQYFEDEIAAGRIVVTVRSGERHEQVKTILRANNAVDVRATSTGASATDQ